MIEITETLTIPLAEVSLTATHSSGPGGQNVNKVSTRITLSFDVLNSPSLSEFQRERILVKLANRITKEGTLIIHAQRHRTQTANRREALDRFADLIREALEIPKPRMVSRPPASVEANRLDAKKRRSEIKQHRGRIQPGQEP